MILLSRTTHSHLVEYFSKYTKSAFSAHDKSFLLETGDKYVDDVRHIVSGEIVEKIGEIPGNTEFSDRRDSINITLPLLISFLMI